MSFAEAIDNLASRLSAAATFTADDFREEFTDKFLRLMLYLTAFDAKARDWVNQEVRVGFDREDNQLNEGFKPEWHHIFPRKVVRDSFDEGLVDSIGNIAVLNEKANRAFSGRPPQQYLGDHGVKPERLAEQAIPPMNTMVVEEFEKFLEQRADLLARQTTAFMQGLTR